MSQTFSIRLREALAEQGKTQEALARDVGVSLRTVQLWAGGEREPKSRNLVDVAQALGRDPGWFYAADEPVA